MAAGGCKDAFAPGAQLSCNPLLSMLADMHDMHARTYADVHEKQKRCTH